MRHTIETDGPRQMNRVTRTVLRLRGCQYQGPANSKNEAMLKSRAPAKVNADDEGQQQVGQPDDRE
jgi:hypothetical protein